MIVLPSTFFERLESSVIAIAALGFLLSIPIVFLRKSSTSRTRQIALESLVLAFVLGTAMIISNAPWATIHKVNEPKFLFLTAIWLPGCICILALTTCRHLKFLSQNKSSEIPGQLTQLVKEEADTLQTKAPKIILTSKNSLLAAVYGNTLYINPKITDQFAEPQIRLILKHELTHIKQRHWYRTFLTSIVAALFWWHPAIHWLKAELDLEREIEADATASTNDPLFYAETLRQIVLLRAKTPALAIQCHATSRRWKSIGISKSGRPLLPALLSIIGALIFAAPLLKPNTTTEIKLPGHSSLNVSRNIRVKPTDPTKRASALSFSQTQTSVRRSKSSQDQR
ncbi:MAG: M56 family metallopeptidase [Fimbriimonadaceae bacterium]|nr:M56 family metallopeptidase [Fimbriimonadaceae bacterium]